MIQPETQPEKIHACSWSSFRTFHSAGPITVFDPILSHPQHAWLTLAMSSTLAGNLTVLGSIANLIVIERARHTIRVSFFEYLKVGVPLTLLTLWIGILILG